MAQEFKLFLKIVNPCPCSLKTQSPTWTSKQSSWSLASKKISESVESSPSTQINVPLLSNTDKYGIYVHRPYQESVGLQAGIVEMKLNEDIEEESEEMEVFGEFVDDIAAQIVGSPPKYLREDQIPEDIIKE